MKRLAEYFPAHTRALDITADVVKHYIQERLGQGAAAATVKNEVGALSLAFTLAFRSGHLPESTRQRAWWWNWSAHKEVRRWPSQSSIMRCGN